VRDRGALLGPEESGRPGCFGLFWFFWVTCCTGFDLCGSVVGVVVWLGPAFTNLLVVVSGWGVFSLWWALSVGGGGLGLVFLPVF
jgi:hypothetical protein